MDYWDSLRDGSVLSVDVPQVMVRVTQHAVTRIVGNIARSTCVLRIGLCLLTNCLLMSMHVGRQPASDCLDI